jgi:hypothetical protein
MSSSIIVPDSRRALLVGSINLNFEMKNFILELIGFHRIHHISWSFGWKFPMIDYASFDKFGVRYVHRRDYHDCTKTGVY